MAAPLNLVEWGTYTSYLLEWQNFIRNHPEMPMHILSYEDLQKDCSSEIKRLCAFLEVEIEDELLESILQKCHIHSMKTDKRQTLSPKWQSNVNAFYKEGFFMYRKGEVGEWKNYFTPALNDKFDQWWRKETKDIDMFKIEYEV